MTIFALAVVVASFVLYARMLVRAASMSHEQLSGALRRPF